MKTTVEIPDLLFRKAKSQAAARGQTLKQFLEEALREKLQRKETLAPSGPAWMRGFGKLRRLHAQTVLVERRIEDAFEAIEDEDRM